jgi:hypothetical protein
VRSRENMGLEGKVEGGGGGYGLSKVEGERARDLHRVSSLDEMWYEIIMRVILPPPPSAHSDQ